MLKKTLVYLEEESFGSIIVIADKEINLTLDRTYHVIS